MIARLDALLVGVMAAAVCAALLAVIALTPAAPGLEPAVAQALPASGVTNPVTGVLLDYRGYDTFLELVIVMLALIGGAALAPAGPSPRPLTGPVPRAAAAVLAPAIVLFSGYLLYAGGAQPGGAFQAGALLAGGLVLLDATGDRRPFWRAGPVRRWGAVAGPAGFLFVGLALMAGVGRFLDYPNPDAAYALILSIEAVATVSIGLTLAALFAARPLEGRG